VHHLCNVFFPVGTDLFRDGVSPSLQLCNLGAILDQYERLFAQIILNNRAAYSDTEVAMAERFISYGEASSMLRSSRFIFMSRYFEGYPCGY